MPQTLDEQSSKAWRLFLIGYNTLINRIEQELEATKLPPLAWYSVLWTLESAPKHELRLHELAEHVLLSRSNTTRLIDRLESAGLLCRRRCPSDRRGAYAVLTEEGIMMRKKMWEVYSKGIQQYFAEHLSPEETETLIQVFDRILKKLPESSVD